jgi:hypothetical protein
MCVWGTVLSLQHEGHSWLSITSQNDIFLLFQIHVCCCFAGRLFGSSSQFEKLTDKAVQKRAESSFRVVSEGEAYESLRTWRTKKLSDAPYK